MDIEAKKAELRKKYKALRDFVCKEERDKADMIIAERLFDTACYLNADTVLVYLSIGSEVCTDPIIKHSLLLGKTVAAPVCTDSHSLIFRKITSEKDLNIGKYGIKTPLESCPEISDFASSICIVPGLSFDASGRRLGYGGGYYDRFLSDYDGTAVGLCRSQTYCYTPLPFCNFDISVDIVITD